MVQDEEIALTIIEGTLIALPLWLAVVRFQLKDLEVTRESDEFSRWGEIAKVIAMGLGISTAFLALFFTCYVSVRVLKGAGDAQISTALNLLLGFLGLVGIQLFGAVSGQLIDRGRTNDLGWFLGAIVGVPLLVILTSFL